MSDHESCVNTREAQGQMTELSRNRGMVLIEGPVVYFVLRDYRIREK